MTARQYNDISRGAEVCAVIESQVIVQRERGRGETKKRDKGRRKTRRGEEGTHLMEARATSEDTFLMVFIVMAS